MELQMKKNINEQVLERTIYSLGMNRKVLEKPTWAK